MTPILALALAVLPGLALAEGARDWPGITAEAQGGEVNLFMWGGADSINAYIDGYIAPRLLAEHGVTLNRIPLADTTEAVNLIQSEKEAGVTTGGAVDLIWINGENFRTLRQGDLLWCGYEGLLPNNALIDWDDPAIATDFGLPVEGCEIPWSRAQFAFAHDAARLPDPPRSIPALLDWVRANPGQFTYPAPPDFNGAAFVRHVVQTRLDPAALAEPFDAARFETLMAPVWEELNALEPFLWREGATYPTAIAQLNDLFANGEVALSFDYNPSQFGVLVDAGLLPDTVRTFGLDGGTLANVNYLAIPFNSPNKAAAMVTLNLMLSPEAQLEKARPEVWGAAPAIDLARLAPKMAAEFAGLPAHPSVIDPALLAQSALPELSADWIAAIEAGWIRHVGN